VVIARAAEELSSDRLLFAVIGLAGFAVIGLAWSGRWRSWAKSDINLWMITVGPPTCAFFLWFALVAESPRHPVVSASGLLVVLWWLASWVVLLVRPAWYGPRWYREWARDPRQDPVRERTRAALGDVPPERNSEALARAARAPAKPVARRRVLLLDPALGRPSGAQTEGTAVGHLLLYPGELVFAADRGDDATRPGPTIRVLPAGDIVDVAPAGGTRFTRGQVRFPRVQVATVDGGDWTFEAARPDATVDDLRRVYLVGRTRTS